MHFRVEKAQGDPAVTAVARLEGDAIVEEVARMLGGLEGDEYRPAARRLDAGLTAARAAVVVLAYDAFPGPVTLGKVGHR